MGEVFISKAGRDSGKTLFAIQRFMEYMDENPGSKVCVVSSSLEKGTKLKMKMKRNDGTIIFISGKF